MVKDTIHFEGDDFTLAQGDTSPECWEALGALGGTGDQTLSVMEFMEHVEVTGDVENCKAYLSGYGAWEDDELADHEANLQRLTWLAGCDVAEQGEVCFCTY